jgi:hopanoid biosynthesis associated protein HpnK
MCADATRRLVVNGDDFGLTPGVNAGIVDAHRHGILTSASLFANAPETERAILIARRTPTLGVGCHLTLVDGIPVLPAWQVPTLAPGGRFRPTWRSFITAALARRIDLAEVERELDAQVDRLRSDGVLLTHLDGHKHVHAYPPVFEIVARLARRAGIRRVRVPCEPAHLASIAWHSTPPGVRRQALENLALAPWAARARRILARHGLEPAPTFFGRAHTGHFTQPDLLALLDRLPRGLSELMMHPGYVDAALGRVPTRLRRERADEIAILTHPAVRAAIARAGIVLARHDTRPFLSESYTHASTR